jgi:hypothetical protein
VVVRIIARFEAHYEVEEVEMGTVYRWCPESVVGECDCGEELTLSACRTTCVECAADHEAFVEEVLEVRPVDKVDHPWRYLQPYRPTRGA